MYQCQVNDRLITVMQIGDVLISDSCWHADTLKTGISFIWNHKLWGVIGPFSLTHTQTPSQGVTYSRLHHKGFHFFEVKERTYRRWIMYVRLITHTKTNIQRYKILQTVLSTWMLISEDQPPLYSNDVQSITGHFWISLSCCFIH